MNNASPQFADSWSTSAPTALVNTGAVKRPPPPSQHRSVRCKLKTVSDVSVELAKLYRECRSGRLDASDLSKLANVLYILSRTLEGSELEKRLENLERKQHGHFQ